MRYRFGGGGAYIWRDLYIEGLIFGILRYPSYTYHSSRTRSTATPKYTLPQRLVDIWSARRLSIYGKVTIINKTIIAKPPNIVQNYRATFILTATI